MIHIYHGDGKGKTTAAAGLALRALGHAQRVCFVQFLKDGMSGEVQSLSKLPGVSVFLAPTGGKFTFQMTKEELAQLADVQEENLGRAAQLLEVQQCDLLVLDEVFDALSSKTLTSQTLKSILETYGQKAEIVLTGRNPAPELVLLANYVTEMRCEKHPYQEGVAAREGVEW